jgi:2-polyprenyl-3-methyl-5-hydroxy-6-metoxy-1,4-benzoquinol methylase
MRFHPAEPPVTPARFEVTQRSTAPEMMDGEAMGSEDFRDCLVDLAKVNRLTRAYAPTLAFFDRLLDQARALGRPLQVVDVGSGYGDLLRRVDAWAVQNRVEVALTGVDVNPWSRRAAEAATPQGRPLTWVTADAFEFRPPGGIDVVISSHFTHHLPNPLVVKFLRWMSSTARLGWFVSDLQRHAVPFHFFRHVAKLARFHRVVQHDGLVSISRAFTVKDWEQLLSEAGLDRSAISIRWRVPFRLTVESLRTPGHRAHLARSGVLHRGDSPDDVAHVVGDQQRPS